MNLVARMNAFGARQATSHAGTGGRPYVLGHADRLEFTIEPLGAQRWQAEVIAAAINGDRVAVEQIIAAEVA